MTHTHKYINKYIFLYIYTHIYIYIYLHTHAQPSSGPPFTAQASQQEKKAQQRTWLLPATMEVQPVKKEVQPVKNAVSPAKIMGEPPCFNHRTWRFHQGQVIRGLGCSLFNGEDQLARSFPTTQIPKLVVIDVHISKYIHIYPNMIYL